MVDLLLTGETAGCKRFALVQAELDASEEEVFEASIEEVSEAQ
jgi:hypothetical protein